MSCLRTAISVVQPAPSVALRLLAIAALVLALPAAARADEPPAGGENSLPRLQVVELSGAYVDHPSPLGIDPMSLLLGGGAKQKSFVKLCEYLDGLAADEELAMVLFDLSAPVLSMNAAQLDEVDRHLRHLRASGKKTFAWLESGGNVHYSIAASCDRVFMVDLGILDLPSAALSSLHYRDAMDLLGVKASVTRVGEYKGAVEPYTNARMSDHLREHYRRMLRSINDAFVDRVGRGRGLTPAAVRACQATRLHTATAARAAGLVDVLAPFGTLRETISAHIGEAVEWRDKPVRKKRQISFFELMSKFMGGAPEGRVAEPSVAVLHLDGTIIDGDRPASGSLVSGPTVDAIRRLTSDDAIRSVVVRVNSPGGSATASEAIRAALAELAGAKPVVYSMGSVAASGGYWITCVGAPIYAERATITGSIGVFALKLSFGTLLRRIGVHVENVTLDDSAAAFSLDRPWSAQEIATLEKFTSEVYARFLELVARSRDMEVDAVDPIAGGRVWSGSQAQALGLVDHLGGLDDALAAVRRQAQLPPDCPVVQRPRPPQPFELLDLFGDGGDDEIRALLPVALLRLLDRRGVEVGGLLSVIRAHLSSEPSLPRVWLLHPESLRMR